MVAVSGLRIVGDGRARAWPCPDRLRQRRNGRRPARTGGGTRPPGAQPSVRPRPHLDDDGTPRYGLEIQIRPPPLD